MEEKKPNSAIACTVCACAHQDNDTCHCTLDTVKIGTHEPTPTVCKCVDCESFLYDESKEHREIK